MSNLNQPHGHRGRRRHWITGLILIGLGSLFLLERLEYIDASAIQRYWPFIIALVGVGHIIDARDARHAARGGFLIFVAFWLYASIEHLWGLSFQTSWPMILIALGLTHIIGGLASRSEKTTGESRS